MLTCLSSSSSQDPPVEERPQPRRPFPTDPQPAGGSAKTVAMVMETNEDFLLPYFRSKGFSVKKGLGRRREVVDPVLEAPLFRAPVLSHSSQLPEERKSRVRKFMCLFPDGDLFCCSCCLGSGGGWLFVWCVCVCVCVVLCVCVCVCVLSLIHI